VKSEKLYVPDIGWLL